MAQLTLVNRSQLFCSATALTAVGLLTVSPPAQAHPMFPLAPACSQYGFNGTFSLKQSNGYVVRFNATGPVASGEATATGGGTGPLSGSFYGAGGITGDKVDFAINWEGISRGHYTGFVANDGFAHGDTNDVFNPDSAHWDSLVPLVCTTPAAPAPAPAPQPAPPDSQTAVARLGVSVNGPTTLPTGMSGTYTVNLSNSGDVSAPVELFISFNGNLQQTDQVTPSGGLNCEVRNYAGGTTSVHCTAAQLQSKATANITVLGRGSAPGTAQLVVNINSSDPAAKFGQKSQQLNVSIS